ncbi:helix-turn-helix domain-containing protein [Streptomyces sp. RK76]|uniref:winged helix-turn-helix transcriptional regulator n=1 Tax=Streptomyces sp. RK76 TaxID=2824896 RepID=UPI001B35B40F|nr:helix-turn-helix transcriptional regulator [Streptomyces sp. RK76]
MAAASSENSIRPAVSGDDLIHVLSARWMMLVVLALHGAGGQTRFGALLRTVPGISNRVLSGRLACLEEHGLVVRDVSPTRPVSITYTLTEQGKQVADALTHLRRISCARSQH